MPSGEELGCPQIQRNFNHISGHSPDASQFVGFYPVKELEKLQHALGKGWCPANVSGFVFHLAQWALPVPGTTGDSAANLPG